METPNPIHIEMSRGEMDLETVFADITGLTKMNFNSCHFNDQLPVTKQRLARNPASETSYACWRLAMAIWAELPKRGRRGPKL
jgi:hypothetical protein